MKHPDEGWGAPGSARAEHYFRQSMSLCRRWMFTGHLNLSPPAAANDSCKKCLALRAKEAPKHTYASPAGFDDLDERK